MSEKDQPGIYQVDLSAEEMNGESITVEPDRYEPKAAVHQEGERVAVLPIGGDVGDGTVVLD